MKIWNKASDERERKNGRKKEKTLLRNEIKTDVFK
jgi:hypothetical protein